MGDFNYDLLKYGHDTSVTNFITTCFDNAYIPLITKPTRVQSTSATCLDNLLTNKPNSESTPGILIDDISDHFPIFYVLFDNQLPSNKKPITFHPEFDLSRKKMEKLNQHLSETDWTKIFTDQNPSSAMSCLNEIISKAMRDICSPGSTSGNKKTVPNQPWFTPGLKISCKKKKNLYKKTPKNPDRLSYYRKYRNIYNRLIKLAKVNYYSKILLDNKHNIKKTWATLKEIIGKPARGRTAPEKLKLVQNDQFSIEEPTISGREADRSLVPISKIKISGRLKTGHERERDQISPV